MNIRSANILEQSQFKDQSIIALGSENSAAFKSIKKVLYSFSKVSFTHENQFSEPYEFIDFLFGKDFDFILLPNPYGNEKRRKIYNLLRHKDFPICVFDRGCLPDSWFFDTGFNADNSSTYSPANWDKTLSPEQEQEIIDYIEGLKVSQKSLEHQGEKIGIKSTREILGVTCQQKVLFIPFQRPNDTSIKFFSGAVGNFDSFVTEVEKINHLLLDSEWVVICKKHPLEIERPSYKLKFAPDDMHINDLLEVSDSVCLINSGVGVLSSIWLKPVFYFGKVFYSHSKLNCHVQSAENLVHELRYSKLVVSKVVRNRFIYYLKKNVYSFASAKTELVREAKSYRNVVRNLDFYEIRLRFFRNLKKQGLKILYITPVIPFPINRGSVVRTNQTLNTMIESGHQVDLLVLNLSEQFTRSIDIRNRISKYLPELNSIYVRQHPKFSSSFLRKLRYGFNLFLESLIFGNYKIVNEHDCPTSFSESAYRILKKNNYDLIFINYLKMVNCIPAKKLRQSIVDLHDIQLKRIENDTLPFLNRFVAKLFRFQFKRSEFSCMKKVGKLIAISSVEEKYIKTYVGSDLNILTIPAAIKEIKENRYLKPQFDLLYVGSNSDANVDGIIWFINEILPTIKQNKPKIKLLIQGRVTRNPKLLKLNNFQILKKQTNIFTSEYIDDISQVYFNSKVVIAPLRKGTGMKIKVIEALSHSAVVIGTSVAFEGIAVQNKESGIVADTVNEFQKAIFLLLDNPTMCSKISKGAVNLVEDNYTFEKTAKCLNAFLSL